MVKTLLAVIALFTLTVAAYAQGPTSGAIQHGAQPNPQEVRPGSPDGDTPSASAGQLTRSTDDRRVLGLPVTTAIVIGGLLIFLFLVAGVIVPNARRRSRARGGGTYGRR